MAQEVAIVGIKGTKAKVTGQEELLVRIGSTDPSGIGSLATETTLAVGLLPSAIIGSTPSFTEALDYEAQGIIKASSGVLYSIFGYNSGPTQFIQLFNSTTVPADASIPRIIIRVEAGKNFYWDSGRFGTFFSTGISWSNSTTGNTKTVGSSDIWLNAQYK